MPKNYTANKLTNISIKFEIPAMKLSEDGMGSEHYAALIQASAIAKNGEMGVPIQIQPQYLGAKKSVPWTAKQIYAAVKNAPLNDFFKNTLKDLYLQGIDEDIT